MSELSCMVAVKRNVTNGGRRPFSPSLATVAACFDRSGSIVSMGDTPQKALVAFITDRKQDAKDKNIHLKNTNSELKLRSMVLMWAPLTKYL